MKKTKEKKTILVTGGAGFIGSHLVDDLLKNDSYKSVVVVDNLSLLTESDDKKENIRHNLNNPKLKFYEVDITKQEKLAKVFEENKPEVVVHLAAIADTRDAVENPDKYINTNINGTLNLLEEAKKHSVEKFVFFSSSSVYGNKNKAPFSEKMQADFPISPYGATKKSGEILAHTYNHNFKLPIVCLRIFNAYGPRMRPNLVLYMWVRKILNNEEIEVSGVGKKMGTRKRDYTYVGDIVDAVNKSIAVKVNFEVLNIGNSKPVALKDLLKKVESVLGIKAKVKERVSHSASVELTHADTKLAKKVIGWKPETKFEDGIKKFVKWYKENRIS